jgi:hypothetical protein
MRPRTAVLAAAGALACWVTVPAQEAPASPASASPASTNVDPQIAGIFTRIAQHVARLGPMLEQVRAAEWVAKGAPDTYIAQLASARQQIEGIGTEMTTLAQHPENLQDCLQGLFRVQSFHHALDSLMGGLRRYQNPPLADLIQSVAAEDEAELDQLQNYILDLANQKDQEFQVVNNEAQRCRATISKQPAPAKTPRRPTP